MAADDRQLTEEARLREKWSNPQAAGSTTAQATPGAGKDQLQQRLDQSKLTNVKICQACQALGTIKRVYEFRVMEEVCEACNGEGCIINKPLTTVEKIAKVEALIASATDLESLQRYEDALRSGKLDAVLNS